MDINSFNVAEFDASVSKVLEGYRSLISKFPKIGNIYNELSNLTASEDNQISQQLKKLADSTNTLNGKCTEIGNRMQEWLNRYRSTISQTDEELRNKISKISENLANYNSQLSSLSTQ